MSIKKKITKLKVAGQKKRERTKWQRACGVVTSAPQLKQRQSSKVLSCWIKLPDEQLCHDVFIVLFLV